MRKFIFALVRPVLLIGVALCVSVWLFSVRTGEAVMSNVESVQSDRSEQAVRAAFLQFHEVYLEAWRDGLDRGDATGILPYYQHLRSVQYARSGWDALEPVTLEQTHEGIRQTVSGLAGSRQIIEDQAVLVRSEREIVVFVRKTIANDAQRFPAFLMQVWIRSAGEDATWLLVRETVEK